MHLVAGHTPESLPVLRELFVEYADATGLDFCFQKFDQELAELPGRYAPPSGRLFVAMHDGRAAGCVALRKLEGATCEMKRLYVRPAFRGTGLGRELANELIEDARDRGYRTMLLDTLASMSSARALYRDLGFVPVAPYYNNPLPGVMYMALELGE